MLVLCGCLHLCGGHYGAMQALTWAKMRIDYSAEKGLIAGVKDTFDDQHPCELCGTIAKAKKDASKSSDVPLSSEFSKLELKHLFPTEHLTAKTPRSDEFTLPRHKLRISTTISPGPMATRRSQSCRTTFTTPVYGCFPITGKMSLKARKATSRPTSVETAPCPLPLAQTTAGNTPSE